MESLKSQAEELRSQDQARLQEYAQLLDIKAARIRKLEGQLKDIAYGTRPYKIDTSKFEVGVLSVWASHMYVPPQWCSSCFILGRASGEPKHVGSSE